MNESLLDDFRVQCEWITPRLHTIPELRARFTARNCDDTFREIGRKIDPELNDIQAVWCGFEFLCEVHEDYISDRHDLMFDKLR
jgi:hypothetical protein